MLSTSSNSADFFALDDGNMKQHENLFTFAFKIPFHIWSLEDAQHTTIARKKKKTSTLKRQCYKVKIKKRNCT